MKLRISVCGARHLAFNEALAVNAVWVLPFSDVCIPDRCNLSREQPHNGAQFPDALSHVTTANLLRQVEDFQSA